MGSIPTRPTMGPSFKGRTSPLQGENPGSSPGGSTIKTNVGVSPYGSGAVCNTVAVRRTEFDSPNPLHDAEREVVERPGFQPGQLAGASPVGVTNFFDLQAGRGHAKQDLPCRRNGRLRDPALLAARRYKLRRARWPPPGGQLGDRKSFRFASWLGGNTRRESSRIIQS